MCDNRAVMRRSGTVLLLIGLLFGESFAVAPLRPSNDLRVAICILDHNAAEDEAALHAPAAYPESRIAGRAADSPAPRTAPAYALYQRPPPAAA